MAQELYKAIIIQSRFRNKYLKEKSADSKIAFNKRRNYFVNTQRRARRNYFAKINISSLTDNKKCWKTVKPSFLDKISPRETINLLENDTVFLVKTHSIIALTVLLKTYRDEQKLP